MFAAFLIPACESAREAFAFAKGSVLGCEETRKEKALTHRDQVLEKTRSWDWLANVFDVGVDEG